MANLVFITGASHGIGRALVESVPWPDTRVVTVSRTAVESSHYITADLSDPQAWGFVARAIDDELRSFTGDRVAFIHCAAVIGPIGWAGEATQSELANSITLNSASPQVLGGAFLEATRGIDARRQLVLMSSGAATTIYPGLAAYCAGKAAVDQWVRTVHHEQQLSGGAEVLSVNPGSTDTAMHTAMRAVDREKFPDQDKFVGLHEQGLLKNPTDIARQIWELLNGPPCVEPLVSLRG